MASTSLGGEADSAVAVAAEYNSCITAVTAVTAVTGDYCWLLLVGCSVQLSSPGAVKARTLLSFAEQFE